MRILYFLLHSIGMALFDSTLAAQFNKVIYLYSWM
jgi:hypothetical protein